MVDWEAEVLRLDENGSLYEESNIIEYEFAVVEAFWQSPRATPFRAPHFLYSLDTKNNKRYCYLGISSTSHFVERFGAIALFIWRPSVLFDWNGDSLKR